MILFGVVGLMTLPKKMFHNSIENLDFCPFDIKILSDKIVIVFTR